MLLVERCQRDLVGQSNGCYQDISNINKLIFGFELFVNFRRGDGGVGIERQDLNFIEETVPKPQLCTICPQENFVLRDRSDFEFVSSRGKLIKNGF